MTLPVEAAGWVTQWGEFKISPEPGQVGGHGKFTVTVLDPDFTLLNAEAAQPGFQTARAYIHLWFAGTTWPDDRVTIFAGTVTEPTFDLGAGTVELAMEGLESLWQKDLGFKITQEVFPTVKCSECEGQIIPIVFGRPVYRVPVCPIKRPPNSVLAFDLNICDMSMRIAKDADVMGFPLGESIELVVMTNTTPPDYDTLTGFFDTEDKKLFTITDRGCYAGRGQTAGIFAEAGLRWVTLNKADMDDGGAQDRRGYVLLFPFGHLNRDDCIISSVSFWNEPDGLDPDEIAFWADSENNFPTSDVGSPEWIILNRLAAPRFPAGCEVVQTGEGAEWVWPANFLPSEEIERVEVRGEQDGVFNTVNPSVYSVNLNDLQFNEVLGRDPDLDDGITTVTMADTSPGEQGYPDDMIYITIRGTLPGEQNPLYGTTPENEAVRVPAAVIAEIASNPWLGNISEFQEPDLEEAYETALTVCGFGLTTPRTLMETLGEIARQCGLLLFVDTGKLVVRRIRRSGTHEWTASNYQRQKGSLKIKSRNVKEMPNELVATYWPMEPDKPHKIVRTSPESKAEIERSVTLAMEFWALQAPSNVAYMAQWWLEHELSRNRRMMFSVFLPFLAAQPGDLVKVRHFTVVGGVETERVNSVGRIVELSHVPGNANAGTMESVALTVECHEWESTIEVGEEPFECDARRERTEQEPTTVPGNVIPVTVPEPPPPVLTADNAYEVLCNNPCNSGSDDTDGDESGSDSGSGDCPEYDCDAGECMEEVEVVTGVSFNSGTCQIEVTTKRICLPSSKVDE